MNIIQILPDNLANQIAAGEVVERPASVVKELVENSLDAGAKRIRIEVEGGGRRLMRVSDDGCGMSRTDAVLAFERHATSKIRTLEDLLAIRTLGFRGEALSSIASVARVELVTKLEEEVAATRVQIEGGKILDVTQAARSRGTTVTVRDLFFNTPARRKFMRSEATETYHLTAVVQHYALAYPEVAFVFVNNGREIFNLPSAKDVKERIFQLFGAQLVENLLPVSGGDEFLAKISGFVSAPHERRSTRQEQFFFVNRRFVRDKVIASGVAEAFRSVLPADAYPVVFLFLQVPPEEVDVNVHPAKTEVRFRRKEAIRESITETIREALRANVGSKTMPRREERSASSYERPQRPTIQESQKALDFFAPLESLADRIEPFSYDFEQKAQQVSGQESLIAKSQRIETPSEKAIESQEVKSQSDAFTKAQSTEQKSQVSEPQNISSFEMKKVGVQSETQEASVKTTQQGNYVEPTQTESVSDLTDEVSGGKEFELPLPSASKYLKKVEATEISASKIKPICQIRNSYIVALDDKGLILIDQHVAHERILFDFFRAREDKREVKTQNLLVAETLDLTAAEVQIFEQIESELEKQGFVLMRLSGRTIAIKGIPSELPPSEARSLLIEILNAAKDEEFLNASAALKDAIAAKLACKAAIKVNTKLTLEQMQWLIDNLLQTSSPTTCPHGRPIILRLSIRDIERGFHRI